MSYWKIYCMEHDWPGLWRRFFRHQVVTIGFPPAAGYKLTGKSPRPWSRVRNGIQRLNIGDQIVVQLHHNRVGRIGTILEKKIGDGDWNPLVPKSTEHHTGEMGRRILVKWDLVNGPIDQDLVIQLPPEARLSKGLVRSTISELSRDTFKKIEHAVADKSNWVNISPHAFSLEKSISDYIAAYPHRLEDGFQPYPDKAVREHVFSDHKRADVLLLDNKENPVIVECKQHTPSLNDMEQLHGYMKKIKIIVGKPARGILVYSGAAKLPVDVTRFAAREKIGVFQYSISVGFSEAR